MEWFACLLCIVALLILLFIWHSTKSYGRLESLGIPVIKPFLCFGSPPLDWHNVRWYDWYRMQHEKLGHTFGHYIGTFPVISTINPDFIKAVYVKNFEEFGDMVDNANLKDIMKTIDLAQGEDWKNLRKILSPTFTSGKLKKMIDPMSEVSAKAIENLKKLVKTGKPIEVKHFFQAYALDTICRCAFSIDTNALEDDDHKLIKAGREIFQGFAMTNWMETIGNLIFYFFPGLETTFPTIMYPESFYKLHDLTNDLIKERKASNEKFDDFIDKIIEVCNDANAPVSPDMIKAQGSIFFAAGFETTSNCLSTLCYTLAKNPDIQDKLYEEILSVLASNEEIDTESINNLPYLDAAIHENLRIHPPIPIQERICKKDVEVEGLKVKKGTYIRMPIYAAHMNPDFFPDPEAFNPDRFLKENASSMKPYTFRGFSGGPRICLGQRFAMVEMKICMARLLKSFKIKACPMTQLEYKAGDPFIMGFDSIYLTFEERS
uniref:Cytochrome P450 3027E1 n=1 Tax=Paracyclopina nana TaxID=565004 RepID=A0A0F7J012_PARNA|nr:cytochrome P450 3027E1 [Paracyclopina nana]